MSADDGPGRDIMDEVRQEQDGDDAQQDRRSAQRYGMDQEVVIRLKEGETLTAQLLDFSLNGFRLLIRKRPLGIGEELRLVYPWGHVVARAVWCRATAKGYEAGLFVP